MSVNWATMAEVSISALASGVGTVALFALGVRGLSDHADARREGGTNALGLGTAVVSFALCVAMVGFGIWIIVSG